MNEEEDGRGSKVTERLVGTSKAGTESERRSGVSEVEMSTYWSFYPCSPTDLLSCVPLSSVRLMRSTSRTPFVRSTPLKLRRREKREERREEKRREEKIGGWRTARVELESETR